jgi:hypothetical protein
MSADDELIEGLEKLLDKYPKSRGLEEWRHLIRRVVYTVAMRILKGFPEIVVGPVRPVAAGPQPPPRPNVGLLLCIATGDCPPPPPSKTPTD